MYAQRARVQLGSQKMASADQDIIQPSFTQLCNAGSHDLPCILQHHVAHSMRSLGKGAPAMDGRFAHCHPCALCAPHFLKPLCQRPDGWCLVLRHHKPEGNSSVLGPEGSFRMKKQHVEREQNSFLPSAVSSSNDSTHLSTLQKIDLAMM